MKRAFYGCFSLFLLMIMAVVFRYPQNNLIPGKMILFTAIWIGMLYGIKGGLGLLEEHMKKKGLNVEKISGAGLFFYTIFYMICLYLVSVMLRSEPVTDYGAVYQTAKKLAMGEAVKDWSYFSMWTNNLGTLSMLTATMKVSLFLGFKDPYYGVLLIHVIQAAAVLLSIFYLTGRVKKKASLQWFSVILFSMWTPVWACTNAFYSDQFSLGGSVIGTAFLFYATESTVRWKKYSCAALAGIFWGLGIVAKVTAAIPLVAFIILWIFFYRKGWVAFRQGLCMLLTLALCVGAMQFISSQYPSKKDESRLKFSTEYWIALGLLGNGTYGDNQEFIENCYLSKNSEARKEYCRQVISEHKENFYDVERLEKKISVIFGTGEISPTSHIYPEKENLLWQWVHYEGAYYWKYCCLCTGFFYAILVLMFIGCIRRFIWTGEEKGLIFMSYLAVFGLFFFLMFWEAQNKQLYNHIPWMTLCTVWGMEFEKIKGMERGKLADGKKESE